MPRVPSFLEMDDSDGFLVTIVKLLILPVIWFPVYAVCTPFWLIWFVPKLIRALLIMIFDPKYANTPTEKVWDPVNGVWHLPGERPPSRRYEE
jgi:hypothetical protein